MNILYQDYSDQSYHGYQYYHGFVKMRWKYSKRTDAQTENISTGLLFENQQTKNTISSYMHFLSINIILTLT